MTFKARLLSAGSGSVFGVKIGIGIGPAAKIKSSRSRKNFLTVARLGA